MIRLHQRGLLAVVQSPAPSPHPPATPTHLLRKRERRLRERECCTFLEAWEDGDNRYPRNEVDLEHDDYDVMRLDKMQHDKILFYISLSFCFSVRSRTWGFVFLFRDLSFCFGFWVFDFACILFLFRALHVYFRVLSVCFVLRASMKTFSFKIAWFYFVFCDSGSCASVLESVFLFWVWFSFFGFVVCFFLIGHHIFDRRLSVNLSTRGNLTRLSISWQFR